MSKSLGDRMKDYEATSDLVLTSRLPVIIRIDGKRFSNFTKKIKADKPFDERFSSAMTNAALETAKHIEGCVFAFTQSDEITLILRNDQSENSEPWFGNRVQKITSIAASMATAHFLSYMSGGSAAYFDARVFVVPNEQEAINAVLWRQNDAVKNNVQAACYYEVARKIGKKTARKKMHGLNQKQQQELLFKETGINWSNYPTKYKRGVGCYKVKAVSYINGNMVERKTWQIDNELPKIASNQEFLRDIIKVSDENL